MPESLTKRSLDAKTLEDMVRAAFGDGARIAQAEELTEGFFNTALRVTLEDGRRSVVKVSPPPQAPTLLTYERDMMRAVRTAMRRAERRDTMPAVRKGTRRAERRDTMRP